MIPAVSAGLHCGRVFAAANLCSKVGVIPAVSAGLHCGDTSAASVIVYPK